MAMAFGTKVLPTIMDSKLRSPPPREGRAFLAEVISKNITHWAPRYNAGDAIGCASAYREVVYTVLASKVLGPGIKELLEVALETEGRECSASRRAWTLRSALDIVLKSVAGDLITPKKRRYQPPPALDAAGWGRRERCVSADPSTGLSSGHAENTRAGPLPKSSVQMCSLPAELVVLIFNQMGARELASSACVCVAWAEASAAEARLRLSQSNSRGIGCERVLGRMGCVSIIDAIEQLEARVGPKPQTRNWWMEWPLLRAEEMISSGQPTLAHPDRFERGGTHSLHKLLKQYALTLAWMVDAGWPPLDAATCIGLSACRISLARQLQKMPSMLTGGLLKHAASSHMLAEILRDRAGNVERPAPLTYASFCCGPSGLAECDDAWFTLLDASSAGADAATGVQIRTSVMMRTSSDPFVIDGLGAPTTFGAIETGWDRLAAPVVCVRSEKPSGGRLRSVIQASPYMYLLPPLATVTLEKVQAPGEWQVHGRTIWRSCLTVSVVYS